MLCKKTMQVLLRKERKMKKILIWILISACLFSIFGCDQSTNLTSNNKGKAETEECAHDWAEATCTRPKFCLKCNKKEGTSLKHSWIDATCTTPKTCSKCKETEGATLEHSWVDATCTTPKTCTTCKMSSGEALGHSFNTQSCYRCHCSYLATKNYSGFNVPDFGSLFIPYLSPSRNLSVLPNNQIACFYRFEEIHLADPLGAGNILTRYEKSLENKGFKLIDSSYYNGNLLKSWYFNDTMVSYTTLGYTEFAPEGGIVVTITANT